MVEYVDDVRSHDCLQRIKILNHTASRPLRLNRTADRDLESVRMAVHPSALAGMVRKYVSRFKAEVLANLHGEFVVSDSRPYGVSPARRLPATSVGSRVPCPYEQIAIASL